MTSYSLFELNEYIKQVVALNFTEPIWVHCEISQVKESRGNVYLNLIQHSEDENQVMAQSAAMIWYKSYLFIKNKLGELLPSILQDGTKVLVKVNVSFHERYGMKLTIEDIDPSYTIGQMEMARQKILEQLKKAGVLEDNQFTYLPDVVQRIAVISSATAAGYADFIAQVENNEYGYQYKIELFQAAMQGANTEREVCAALDAIKENIDKYDCVAIIRGGGSKLDLASFDNYNIGHKIASFPIPVITGIGHEIDSTVADIVSYSPLKTPTAVASFFVNRNMQFEAEILEMMAFINQISTQKVEFAKLELEQITQLVKIKPLEITKQAGLQLTQLKELLKQAAKYSLKELAENINFSEKIIKISDPQNTLKRGYILLKKGEQTITSLDEIKEGDAVELNFHNGSTSATINKKSK